MDILRSSAFGYSSGDAKTGMASVFGRGAVTGFDGRDGDVDVDGTVRSLMLGTDFRREEKVFGALLAHSSGKGDYREGTEEEGRIRSTLTGLYPYAGHETDHLSLWGIAGFGRGEVTVHQDKSPYRTGASVTTDMDLLMAAGGIRSELMEPGPENSIHPFRRCGGRCHGGPGEFGRRRRAAGGRGGGCGPPAGGTGGRLGGRGGGRRAAGC